MIRDLCRHPESMCALFMLLQAFAWSRSKAYPSCRMKKGLPSFSFYKEKIDRPSSVRSLNVRLVTTMTPRVDQFTIHVCNHVKTFCLLPLGTGTLVLVVVRVPVPVGE
jgi:hypothetical protein